jgi:hypothetical protein
MTDQRHPLGHPPALNPVQAWLLGYIDLPTLHDRAAAMGEGSADVFAMYGRAVADRAYAEALIEEAQQALGTTFDELPADKVGRYDVAYDTYVAATDPSDEALLLAQEAEGQPVGDEWADRLRELEEARDALGLRSSGEQVAEQEAER